MSQIDWSKAPEGATHYGPGGGAWVASWYIVGENTLATMLDDGFDDEWGRREIDAEDMFSLLPLLIARPTPQWNGEGEPPLGTICTYKTAKEQLRVFAIDGDYAAVASEFTKFWCLYDDLKPIRTTAQIAADEREAAVRDIYDVISGPGDIHAAARRVYDAGFRKP